MPPHHTPHLIIDNTHRATVVPDEWCAEHLQVETEEERLYTASELVFACYLAGFAAVMVTFAAALCWSWWLS